MLKFYILNCLATSATSTSIKSDFLRVDSTDKSHDKPNESDFLNATKTLKNSPTNQALDEKHKELEANNLSGRVFLVDFFN